MKHDYFDIEIARNCGLNAATIASFLWEILAEDPRFFWDEGFVWVKVSQRMMTITMPYFTRGQVAYAVNKLVDGGYIKKAKLSKGKFDHTNWYAFTEYGRAVMSRDEDSNNEDG